MVRKKSLIRGRKICVKEKGKWKPERVNFINNGNEKKRGFTTMFRRGIRQFLAEDVVWVFSTIKERRKKTALLNRRKKPMLMKRRGRNKKKIEEGQATDMEAGGSGSPPVFLCL